LNGIAACYDKLNRYDLAVNYYYQALGVDPESTRTLSNLGYSFLLQKRNADAQRVLSLALNKDPGNVFIKRNLALATSHVQELAKGRPQDNEKEQVSPAAAPAEITVAVDTEPSEASAATTAGNIHTESAASGMIVRVTDDAETQVNEAMQKVAPEPLPTVAEVATVEEQAVPAPEPQKLEEASAQMNTEVAVIEPATVAGATVADSGLLPAIEIISQVEEPTEPAPELQKVEAASAQMNTEVATSEPAPVAGATVADSGLLPAIEIISQVEEPTEPAPELQKVDEASSAPMNAEMAVSEPATVTEADVADSGLLPAIEIISQVEEPTEPAPKLQKADEASAQMNMDVTTSEQATMTEVAVADSGLLPTIDISSESTEQLHRTSETSAQKVPGIATIDVDAALAEETNIVKVANTATVPVSGTAEQPGAMQDQQSISPVTLNDSHDYTIEVSNGNGWNGMARLLGNHLKSNGERVVRLTNADTFSYKDTVIYYSSGKRGVAERVADKFPVQARLQETKWNRKDIDVRVVIGEDVTLHAPVIRRSLYAWDNNDASKSVTASVEVSNGNGRNGMARLLKSVLVSRGDSISRVTNADNFDHRKTVIYFSKGKHKDAQQLAAKLPVQAILKETQDNRSDIDLRIVLGKDFLNYEVAMRRIMDANA
jgi:hypothetical protein